MLLRKSVVVIVDSRAAGDLTSWEGQVEDFLGGDSDLLAEDVRDSRLLTSDDEMVN